MPAGAAPTRGIQSGRPTSPHPWGRRSPLAREIRSLQFLVLPVESGAPCLGRLPGPQTQPSMRIKLRAQARPILSKS